MDNFDRKLLNLLQQDSGLTAEQLSALVPLSPSAITRRIKRMREIGAISHNAAVVSPVLRQKRVNAIIVIQLDQHTPSQVANLRAFLRDAAEVQVCLEITGSADMVLIVSMRDMSHFNEFADTIGGHPLVRRYETSFVKREIKMSLAIELSED